MSLEDWKTILSHRDAGSGSFGNWWLQPQNNFLHGTFHNFTQTTSHNLLTRVQREAAINYFKTYQNSKWWLRHFVSRNHSGSSNREYKLNAFSGTKAHELGELGISRWRPFPLGNIKNEKCDQIHLFIKANTVVAYEIKSDKG